MLPGRAQDVASYATFAAGRSYGVTAGGARVVMFVGYAYMRHVTRLPCRAAARCRQRIAQPASNVHARRVFGVCYRRMR